MPVTRCIEITKKQDKLNETEYQNPLFPSFKVNSIMFANYHFHNDKLCKRLLKIRHAPDDL